MNDRRVTIAGRRFCAALALLLATQAGVAGTPEIDACSLLSAAQISRVINLPVEEGVRKDEGLQQNGAYSSACVWVVRRETAAPENPQAPLGGRSFVILNAIQWPAGSGLARTFLEAFHAAAAKGEIASQPVPRQFGDEALWWGDGLAVRTQDVSFGVSVFLPGGPSRSVGFFEEKLAPSILRSLCDRDRA